jgi:hypothetical protein
MMKRIEDWADRVADVAWCEAVELTQQAPETEAQVIAALEQLRQAARRLQLLAYERMGAAS